MLSSWPHIVPTLGWKEPLNAAEPMVKASAPACARTTWPTGNWRHRSVSSRTTPATTCSASGHPTRTSGSQCSCTGCAAKPPRSLMSDSKILANSPHCGVSRHYQFLAFTVSDQIRPYPYERQSLSGHVLESDRRRIHRSMSCTRCSRRRPTWSSSTIGPQRTLVRPRRCALGAREQTFGVRQIDAYTAPTAAVGLTTTWSGVLDGGALGVTPEGQAAGATSTARCRSTTAPRVCRRATAFDQVHRAVIADQTQPDGAATAAPPGRGRAHHHHIGLLARAQAVRRAHQHLRRAGLREPPQP